MFSINLKKINVLEKFKNMKNLNASTYKEYSYGKRSPKQALILILLQLIMFGIIAWIFATVCRMCSVTHNGLGYGFYLIS